MIFKQGNCRGVVGNIARHNLAAVSRQFDPHRVQGSHGVLWLGPFLKRLPCIHQFDVFLADFAKFAGKK